VKLPPWPVDEQSLGLLHRAVRPPKDAERSSLSDLCLMFSEMAGADLAATEPAQDLEGVEILRDPEYHANDIIAALVEEIWRLRGRPLVAYGSEGVPNLLTRIVQEQAKHAFATLTTCACGYAPADNASWTAHRAAVAVEAVAAWIESQSSPRIDEPGPGKLASAWAAEMIREGLKP
jgi:hypothetical protein